MNNSNNLKPFDLVSVITKQAEIAKTYQSNKSLFLYEINQEGQVFCGFIGIVPISLVESGKIKGHEEISIARKSEIIKQIKNSALQIEPILLVHNESAELFELQQMIKQNYKEIFSFSDGKKNHRAWEVNDSFIIEKIVKLYNQLNEFLIADGHHRTSAVYELAQENTKSVSGILALLLPYQQVKISSIHRILTSEMQVDLLLQLLNDNFEIEKSNKPVFPTNRNKVGMYAKGSWLKLTSKSNLQVSYEVIKNILMDKIKKYDFNETLFYGNDVKKFESAAAHNGIGITFCSLTIEEVIELAIKKEKLPSKSTWIEPKIPAGIFNYHCEVAV